MSTPAETIELHRRHGRDEPDPPYVVGDFDDLGPPSRAAYPHRHRFYELILVSAGRGSHLIEAQPLPLQPPQLGLITPGHIHSWKASELRGRLLLFEEPFFPEPSRDRALWESAAKRPWRKLERAEHDRLAELLERMAEERRRRDRHFLDVARAYLRVLLLRIQRDAGSAPLPAPTDRLAATTRRFRELLERRRGSPTSVSQLATRLGVSPGHLAQAVKTVTGCTPGQLIRQERTLEARRLLAGTELSVAQVARNLGFDDPAYFCRFFRRETGVTPGFFRRAHAQKDQTWTEKSIDQPQ